MQREKKWLETLSLFNKESSDWSKRLKYHESILVRLISEGTKLKGVRELYVKITWSKNHVLSWNKKSLQNNFHLKISQGSKFRWPTSRELCNFLSFDTPYFGFFSKSSKWFIRRMGIFRSWCEIFVSFFLQIWNLKG